MLDKYVEAYPGVASTPAHYVFFSTYQVGHNYTKPMTRERAWLLVSEMCQDVRLKGNYGTHTLRKTWGYHARLSGVPLELIMHQLNQSMGRFGHTSALVVY